MLTSPKVIELQKSDCDGGPYLIAPRMLAYAIEPRAVDVLNQEIAQFRLHGTAAIASTCFTMARLVSRLSILLNAFNSRMAPGF